MAKLSYSELRTLVAQVATQGKMLTNTFTVTRDNIAGLVDKIGRVETIDTVYEDKMADFDAGRLDYGWAVEEWQQDLTLPVVYSKNASSARTPVYPTYRPANYSLPLDEKYFPTSVPIDDINKAVNNADQLTSITSMIIKRLYDSRNAYKYEIKRQAVGNIVEKAISLQNAPAYAANTAATLNIGAFTKDSGKIYVVVKKIANGTAAATAKADGSLIETDFVTTIAKPVDNATGTAFVKQVKSDIEQAMDMNEGHSFSGNSLGASQGMVLFVKQGLLPSLEVDVEAGAFHMDKVAIPAEIRVLPDFGNDTSTAYAVLMDKRMIRYFTCAEQILSQENINAKCEDYNLFHKPNCMISYNTFFKVYKES